MKKEIIGILFFFMVVFSLISLLSFDPADPCLFFNAQEPFVPVGR